MAEVASRPPSISSPRRCRRPRRLPTERPACAAPWAIEVRRPPFGATEPPPGSAQGFATLPLPLKHTLDFCTVALGLGIADPAVAQRPPPATHQSHRTNCQGQTTYLHDVSVGD